MCEQVASVVGEELADAMLVLSCQLRFIGSGIANFCYVCFSNSCKEKEATETLES